MKVTWLGEDTDDVAGPSFNVWNGIKFPKGQPVEVADPHMIAKAKINHFYRVADGPTDTRERPHVEQTQVEGSRQEGAQGEKFSPAVKDYPPVKKPKRKKAKAHSQAERARAAVPIEPDGVDDNEPHTP